MQKPIAVTAVTLMLIAGAGVAIAEDSRSKGPDFATLDVNSDGSLTADELLAHAQARFAAKDTDGDGALSKDEITNQGERGSSRRAERRADRMISRRDSNGDGMLQWDEIHDPQRAARHFDVLDSDNDNLVSEAEFEEAKQFRRGNGRRHGGGKDNG